MEPIPQIPRALAVIENVCNISSTVLVNKHQCKRLVERFSAIGAGLRWFLKEFAALKEAGTLSNISIVSRSGSDSHYPAFDVLLRVLQKGEALVVLYSTKEGLWSKFQDAIRIVVSRRDNREAFEEIHEELDTMKAQFDFEGFSEPGNVDFESSSGLKRSEILTADAKRDLEEMPQLLSNIQEPILKDHIDLEKVTQVILQKMEHVAGADVEWPINLQIDLTAIEKLPCHPQQLHEYQNINPDCRPECVKTIGEKGCRKINSNQHREENHDWVAINFGRWLGCDFAMKTFRSNSADRASWNKEQLMKEVGSLIELRHPHIVQLVGFDPEQCVYLMELMKTDLRDFMKQKTKMSGHRPFSSIEELDIITQIAKGMYYLHTKEYAHGDLKCSNILVNGAFPTNFEVKISDLRNAQKLGKDWDPVAFKQAKWRKWPRCIPPEAMYHYDDIEPSSDLLKKSDVFSFGITCYEIVTGKYPFDGMSNDEVKKQIAEAKERPLLPGNMDADLKGLIEYCWDHDPNNRPDFASICYILKVIKSKKPVVAKWIPRGIPQVQEVFTLLLGLVFQANESATGSPVRHELSTRNSMKEDGLHRSDSGVSVPAYLRIQPDQLKRLHLVGKGAFAEVYKTTWLGCTLAAKTFQTHSPISVLQREVDFLIHLRHPYLVQLVGLCVDSQQRCSIVMEYMSGNLRELIESQIKGLAPHFTTRDTVLIISKIALGMAFLHFKGVVHRDLKSANVMVNRNPGNIDVKIVDFGLSQHEHTANSTQLCGFYLGVGTGFWRAPEILPTKTDLERSEKPDLKAADVYSFAMTCYEVLTRKVPFEEYYQLRQSEYDKVISGLRPTLPSDLHPELKVLVEQCWHGDPVKRPSFTKICKELRRIEHALPNSATSVWESVTGSPSWSSLALVQCCAFRYK